MFGRRNPYGGGGGGAKSAPPGMKTMTAMLAACATVLILPEIDSLTSGWVRDRAALHYGYTAGEVIRWVWAGCLGLLLWSALRIGFWVATMSLVASGFSHFLPI